MNAADPLTLTGTLKTAREHCTDCFAYHATWRAFRTTGLKGHPGWHREFYRLALHRSRLAYADRLRVLICGASDEAMPATLAGLVGAARLDVHLVDRCTTPLKLAATYAEHTGLNLTTHQATAPELPIFDRPFDLVVTDGLLALLPRDAVPATITSLAGLLHEDGALAYTARVTQPPRTRLEYDRPGRWIQAATILAAHPDPPHLRRAHAAALLHRPSRTSPFSTPGRVQDAFASAFADTAAYVNRYPASLAQRLHPAHRHGATTWRVGVLAQHPHPTGSPA